MKLTELLSDKSKWTTKAWARDAEGTPCLISSESAVCFCLSGAISRCYKDNPFVLGTAIGTAISLVPNITDFNDTSSYEEVFAVAKKIEDAVDEKLKAEAARTGLPMQTY